MIGEKIQSAVEFAGKVKEVETLVKSVDELAKAIGKKIQQNNDQLTDDSNHNGSLIAGVFQVVLNVKNNLANLEGLIGVSDDIKQKVTKAKTESVTFLSKLKTEHTALGKQDAQDTDAKKAILRSDNTGDKGVAELIKLNTAIDELLNAAKDAIKESIGELTVKPAV
ncbi:Variable small protein 3 (plasmid) [Borrelia crocidurae str. Achema]|uniref:Variable small protein 3 n=1 Tax=Borrelia crocidurae (strain Achema) TaxID=1155096 RepID=I0FEP6_BORCA|nr:Variable small protein 3 [Borrelia crocidurae str. Achema]